MMRQGLALVWVVLAGSGVAAKEYYPPEVENQFREIAGRAEALGFGIGPATDPDLCRHYQGMVRTSGPGTPYFFVSKSGNKPSSVPICLQTCEVGGVPVPCSSVGDGYGELLVVKWGSRDSTGERLRSNRLVRNTDTDESAPDARDAVVAFRPFNGSGEGDARWPNYGHPGGMQLVDDVLVIPLETPYTPGEPEGLVLFVNVSDPENPVPFATFAPDAETGLVAVTREPDGHFLMLLTGGKNERVRVFRSSGTDLTTKMDWSLLDSWFATDELLPTPDEVDLGQAWPLGGGAHQTLNFVREGGPDGTLYLIGGRDTNGGLPAGDDYFDLYRVEWRGGEFKMVWVASRHVTSTGSLDGSFAFVDNLASLSAGVGVYVSPSGELILYGTEHENDGPEVAGVHTVKAAEFRHRWITRYGSSSLDPTVEPGGPYRVAEGSTTPLAAIAAPPTTRAWVQLWADPDWDDRYAVVDYADRTLDDWEDFEDLDDANLNPFADGFGDQASSVAWFAPAGCTIRLHEDDREAGASGGAALLLESVGEEQTGFRPDLDGSGFDDEISAVSFSDGCDAYYQASIGVTWDLDRDGTFETAGAGASFPATALDGPSVLDVPVRATHPTDGRTGSAIASIEVFNVAPAVATPVVRDPAGHRVGIDTPFLVVAIPARLTATFTDAGRPDTHLAQVAWGDGTTTAHGALSAFVDSTGGGVGSFAAAHRFTLPGNLVVTASATDDDGGTGAGSLAVRVAGPAELLGSVVSEIDALLSRTLDPAVRAALERARTHVRLALDRLAGADLDATMSQIVAAIVALDDARAKGGPDVAALTSRLALASYAIAQTAHDAAVAATPNPTAQQAAELARSAAAIAEGARLVAIPRDADAARMFRDAV